MAQRRRLRARRRGHDPDLGRQSRRARAVHDLAPHRGLHRRLCVGAVARRPRHGGGGIGLRLHAGELLRPRAGASEAIGVPVYATIFISMFLHGGFLHLAGNMLYLWIFGNNIEEAMGHVKFTLFYFLSGVAAALTMGYIDAGSNIPMIGASGAISACSALHASISARARACDHPAWDHPISRLDPRRVGGRRVVRECSF